MNIDQFEDLLIASVKKVINEIKEQVKADILKQDHVQKHLKYLSNQLELNLQKLKMNLVFAQENIVEDAYLKEKAKNNNQINQLISKLPKPVQQALEKRGNFFYDNLELDNFEFPLLNFKKYNNCSGFFQIKDEQRNGRGIEFFDSGAYFEGYFKNDKACGKGYYISAQGLIHQGNNKDNVYSGYGEWPLEESFIGDHDENQANGFGKKLYNNGEMYIGFWKNNKRSGYGEMYRKEVLIQRGIYHVDKLVKQL